MNFRIRNEESCDIDQVRQVLRAAFLGDVESRLVDMVRARGHAMISLVAVQDDQVLGHILFSPVSIGSPVGAPPPEETSGIGLAPVAVRPDVQSQGIGSQLIREGLRVGKELEYDYCVVLGSPQYYHRFGFTKASQYGLQNEYATDEEFMIMWLTNRRTKGLVKYGREFCDLNV